MKVEALAYEILEKVGIKRGQVVLDFGCGSGTYTIPAAKLVADSGEVFALDKDREVLDELMQKAESESLGNIRRMETPRELEIKLPDKSVDVVLLFDVFHSYYFPRIDDRRKLLDEVRRVLKPNGLISVWPKHMESETKNEIEGANFSLKSKYSGTLIHDSKDIEKGQVLNFRKLAD